MGGRLRHRCPFVSVNDPGRPEGKTKRIARREFLAALQKAGGGADPSALECVVMVGNYPDGWHADGRSRMFVDYYKSVGPEIGFPFDNGGSFSVHSVGSCIVQDYVKPAAERDSATKSKQPAFLESGEDPRLLGQRGVLREVFFHLGIRKARDRRCRKSIPSRAGRRQDFEKGSLTWNGKDVLFMMASAKK